MVYHVIRRSPHNSSSDYQNGSISQLMPRYHYSKITPSNATASSESFFPRQHLNGQSTKPLMTATTTSNNNNNNQYSYGSFKSTFIPLVTNIRTMTPNKREFIQIPITREDGTTIPNNALRTVPVTFISETTPLPTTTNGNSSPKPSYTNLVRPGSKYSHHHSIINGEESSNNIPRLPSVSRRLSLTIPVMTTITKNEDDTIKQNIPLSSFRQIPIRLSQPSNAASIPTNSTRISSAILRSSSLSNPSNNQLKRQKTDLTDISSSDLTSAPLNISSPSPVRRAEVMAREAIQGVARFQQQQQQQRNDSISDNNNNNVMIRSPSLSRRVIINLRNNQSVSLDSRLLSANSSFTKPPPTPGASRLSQRNNLYHIPGLHDIQIPSHSTSIDAEPSLQVSRPPSASSSNRLNNSYKNEFHMEIPITILTTNDQENSIQQNDEKEDGILDYDQSVSIVNDRLPSANGNSNPTLKSILKRSSSRETISRKNVSFTNV
jgi:hypothetical protein